MLHIAVVFEAHVCSAEAPTEETLVQGYNLSFDEFREALGADLPPFSSVDDIVAHADKVQAPGWCLTTEKEEMHNFLSTFL